MRESNWKYRAIIVATVVDSTAINDAVATNLDRVGGELTLTAELATAGVVTHRWCNSQLTRTGVFGDADAGTAGLLQLASVFPAAQGYVWPDPENPELLAELQAAFAGVANVSVGDATGEQVLTDLGLSLPEIQE